MKTLPLLYTYRRCPYAMRARMALLLAGIAFDAFEIVLRDKPAEMLVASPKGTVPVLCLPGGSVIDQSWDIVQWALASGSPDFWERSQTPENLDMLARNDGVFKQHLDRYKYPQRFQHEGCVDRSVHRQHAVEVLLNPLEARLTQAPFLGGESACATDIGIFPFVRQFAAVEPGWFAELPLPWLKAWLSQWLESPLFEACMHKLPPQHRVGFPPLGASAPTPAAGIR